MGKAKKVETENEDEIKIKEEKGKIEDGRKIEGKKYLTSFISYMFNYFLILLAILFLLLLFFVFDFKTTFQPENFIEAIPAIFLFGILILILYLIQEPFFERAMKQYYVSEDEIIKVEGIISKKRIAFPYPNVADVRLSQGIFARIFNYGDIIVSGFKENIVMKGIRNPQKLYQQIKEKVSASMKTVK